MYFRRFRGKRNENKGLVVVSVATNIYTLPNINKRRKGFHSRSINNFQKRASIQTEEALLCRAILKILAEKTRRQMPPVLCVIKIFICARFPPLVFNRVNNCIVLRSGEGILRSLVIIGHAAYDKDFFAASFAMQNV